MMWPYGYSGGWGWMVFGWFMMVVFWVLVVAGAVAVIRWASARGTASRTGSPETPVEILRRRYAAGELTKEQFEAMKRNVA